MSEILHPLMVERSLVPFDFRSRHEILNEKGIMVNDSGIVLDVSEEVAEAFLCLSYHWSLAVRKQILDEARANYRWIGDVPLELQGLTWLEEDLVFRAHLIGKIVRLQNRNVTSYFSIKGHMVLVPQDTRRLVNLLLSSPDSLVDNI
jgi:hypothetical protein